MDVYNTTMEGQENSGGTPLAYDTLIECWSLFSVLKMVQGVGVYQFARFAF